jgi:hypothetical protein
MADAAQYFSDDLMLGATGDLQVADSVLLSQQRILRRLMTNPGDYIWEPTYGAGLPAMIGKTFDITAVTALIQSQMFMESSVQQQPAPQIIATPFQNGMYVQIQYVEVDSGLPTVLSFDVTA